MKIRLDFVTNSSSSSFIAFGVYSPELVEYMKAYAQNGDTGSLDDELGIMEINGDCVTVTRVLGEVERFWSSYYYVDHDYRGKCSLEEQIRRDSEKGKTKANLFGAFSSFYFNADKETSDSIEKLLEEAWTNKWVVCQVYEAQTDDYYGCDLSDEVKDQLRNFVPKGFEIKNGKLVSYASNTNSDTLIIPFSVTSLSPEVFKGCKFKKVMCSHYVNMQARGIFSNCTQLEEINFVSSPYVPEDTFKGCVNLKKVFLPKNICGIEKGAFAGCKNLENINIPKSIRFIESGAFAGCEKLENNPKLWSEICSLIQSKTDFIKGIRDDETYIRTHGGASFKPDSYEYFESIIDAKANYELWHSIYDFYIDEVPSLDYGLKFSVYAEPKYTDEILSPFSDALEELQWKRVQNISKFTDVLVIETDEIYQFDRFVKKQQHIKFGREDIVKNLGSNLLEKAIEIKDAGGKILIITLNNFLSLLANRAFNEETKCVVKSEKSKAQREAEKIAKKENIDARCEELITSIVSKNKEFGTLFTNVEIVAMIEESSIPTRRFETFVSGKYNKSIKALFEELGVLKTVKTEFYALVALLKERYENKAKVSDVTALIADNADLDLSIVANNSKCFTGLSTREYLFSEGILAGAAVKTAESLTEGVLFKPGEEPADIKKRIDTLFEKLDGAYPDKVIAGLHKEHKKWGETVTDLYRKLGYKSGADFLTAYGYKMSDDKGGRPKAAGGGMEVIEVLKRRYPNGANFKDIQALFDANPDLASKLNTLRTSGFKVDGMTFGKYLKFIGLMGK